MEPNLESKFEIPKIHLLRGEENITDWELQLFNTLKWHGLIEYITTDVPEPADPTENLKWKRNRLATNLLMVPSLEKVSAKLETAGWDKLKEDNPKVIYDLVKKVISKTTEDALSSLVVEFSHLDRAKFSSLEEFQKRAQWLKN